MANDSLTKFANVLYAEALDEKKKVMEKLRTERENILAEKDAELEMRFRSETERYRTDIDYEISLALSKREAELARALRENRANVAAEVFAAARAKLVEFTGSAEYEEYLRRELDSAAEVLGAGQTECAARKCDFDLVKKLLPAAKLGFKEAADDIIGGFTLKNAELSAFIDCTIKTKLEEQREKFFEFSGLVID